MKYRTNPSLDNRSVVLTIACIFLLVSLIPSSTLFYPNAAFGDGLFMEELSASIGDRKWSNHKDTTAYSHTAETLKNQNQKPVIQFKLYDPNTNEGYKHGTYYITIEKDGKKLLSDWFHDHKWEYWVETVPIMIFIDNVIRFAHYPKRKIEVLKELGIHLGAIKSMVEGERHIQR